MSTSQQPTPKSHRRPAKKPHHGTQSSRSVVSDNDAYTTIAEQTAVPGDRKQRPRGKSHASKKGQNHNDAAVYSDGPIQRSVGHPVKTQATPIKQQAYAGPTFHQSPAPSALPIPSFYSKSLPTGSPMKPGLDGSQSPAKTAAELPQAAIPPLLLEPKRESTPLDFLFDAARKAGATPGTESPNHRNYLSSAADTPVSRSPAAREGDADFPFELDSGDQASLDNVSTLSTPYKDRIDAARSQRTSSTGGKSLDEDERKAKTAALKSFLMTSAQTGNSGVDDNPFNARPAPPPNRQYQHRSNPNTPYNHSAQGYQHQYFPPMPPVPPIAHYQSPSRPGPPSQLRHVYQPEPEVASTRLNGTTEHNRISTAREQTSTGSNFADIYNTPSKSRDQNSGHRATPSAQQLEDDLRKFLKLDLVSRV